MRLIDADALMKEVDRIHKDHYTNSSYQFIHDFFLAMFRRIRKQSTIDAVPVVRCKDCKYYGDEDFCPLRSLADYTDSNDFCCMGERRSDD